MTNILATHDLLESMITFKKNIETLKKLSELKKQLYLEDIKANWDKYINKNKEYYERDLKNVTQCLDSFKNCKSCFGKCSCNYSIGIEHNKKLYKEIEESYNYFMENKNNHQVHLLDNRFPLNKKIVLLDGVIRYYNKLLDNIEGSFIEYYLEKEPICKLFNGTYLDT